MRAQKIGKVSIDVVIWTAENSVLGLDQQWPTCSMHAQVAEEACVWHEADRGWGRH